VVLYRFLSFPIAYNWTLVVHGLAAGLGMYLLLNSFAPEKVVTNAILALSYQFCGPHAMYFGYPWIIGSSLWLPWMWLSIRWLEMGRYS
jgi:hypothetical protein